MKKLVFVTFLLCLIAASSFVIYAKRENYASLYRALDPCKEPILFRVESVDKRFNLTNNQVISYANEAADIWNESYGQELFSYSEDGELSLSMVFDSRQQTSNKINELDKNVEFEKDKLDSMIKKHRDDVSVFKQKLADHNATVQKWNAQGGAPPEEFEKLTEEEELLEQEAKALNDQARSLNLASEDYNLQVGELNEVISDFNEDLERKPEEGLYIGSENRIEIYFNNDRNELIHTIAHEFGHARAVDHNNNPKSIMYPYSTKIVTLSNDDVADLNEVCRQKSPVEVIQSRLRL